MFRRTVAVLMAATVVVASCGGDGPDAPGSNAAPAATVPIESIESTGSNGSIGSSSAGQAPEALRFVAPLVGGGEIDLAGFAGRPVLLWFWAPY